MHRIVLLDKIFKSPIPPFTKGGLRRITSKRGLTLVEVMIALVVALVVFLALMQTALVGIDSNMRNLLRDEAVNIAEMRMNEARNALFTDIELTDTGGSFVTEPGISRDFRNFSITFTPSRRVDDLNSDNKQIDITVAWTWKGENYTHSITTILRRQ